MVNQVKPVLIIADDHKMLTKLFEGYFKSKGYDVAGTAENSEEVLSIGNFY